jgi:hypothetical protein
VDKFAWGGGEEDLLGKGGGWESELSFTGSSLRFGAVEWMGSSEGDGAVRCYEGEKRGIEKGRQATMVVEE